MRREASATPCGVLPWALLAAVLSCVPARAGAASVPRSKKAAWLAEKRLHRGGGALGPAARTGRPPAPVVSLRNVWTTEVLPIVGEDRPAPAELSRFLRCHFTGRTIAIASPLLPGVLAAARHFHDRVVEIVSGFRAPKYNLYLHKKGHQVAKDSQHMLGHAIDFRLPGIDTWALRQFVRSRHLGGVGYYPRSDFVHMDVGPIRTWQGD